MPYGIPRPLSGGLESRESEFPPTERCIERLWLRLGLRLGLHFNLIFLTSDSRVQFSLCLSTGTSGIDLWVYLAACIRSSDRPEGLE